MYSKFRAIWIKNNTIPIEISLIDNISTNEDDKPINNSCSFETYDYDKLFVNGMFQIQDGDTIVLYAKRVTSNDDKDFSDDDILWTGVYLDYSQKINVDGRSIKIEVTDLTYNIFNRILSFSYVGYGLRTNEIIENAINQVVDNYEGLGNIVFNFDNIDTTRSDGSLFPIIEPSYANKPLYEWISELSRPTWTNNDSEITQIQTDKMIFRIKGSNVYWNKPTNDIVYTLTNRSIISDITESTGNKESTNRLIIEAGEDFLGEPIYTYIYDDNNTSKVIKERYTALKKIGGINNTYDNQYHQLRKNYSIATNSDFKTAVRKLCESYKEYWFSEFGRAKRKITFTIPYNNLNIGDEIYVNVTNMENIRYTINRINHKLNKSIWTTSLTCEQVV